MFHVTLEMVEKMVENCQIAPTAMGVRSSAAAGRRGRCRTTSPAWGPMTRHARAGCKRGGAKGKTERGSWNVLDVASGLGIGSQWPERHARWTSAHCLLIECGRDCVPVLIDTEG